MDKQKKTKSDQKEMKPNLEAEEYKNKYLRALADYHNLEKRVENHIDIQVKNTKKKLLLKLLDILDNIERAEVFITDPGLKLVAADFHKLLKDEQVVEMDLLNKPYDPHVTECVEVVAGDTDNMVSEIVRKGYLLNEDVLRVAQVKVTKKLQTS